MPVPVPVPVSVSVQAQAPSLPRRAVPGVSSVLRPLVEPTAASVNAMAELLREFISIPSVRRPCVFVPGGAPCHAVRADADDHRVALRSTQVNPDQVAKAGTNPLDDPNCGEHAYATCLASKFEALGCEVILEDCTNGWAQAVEGFAPRSNIYVVLQSKKNPDAKWLAIDTHLDTVRRRANSCQPRSTRRVLASRSIA